MGKATFKIVFIIFFNITYTDSYGQKFVHRHTTPPFRDSCDTCNIMKITPKYLDNKPFELQIFEYYYPVKGCTPFSLDYNFGFYYYGDLKGAYGLLLQTRSNALPHVKFKNFPSDSMYVYFHAIGPYQADTKGGGMGNAQKTWFNTIEGTSDGRGIVLKTLTALYRVNVEQSMDSLDVYAFQVQDSMKLFNHFYKLRDEDILHKQPADIDKPFVRSIWLLAFTFEKLWNVYVEDESNTDYLHDNFLFLIPSNMFESPKQYPELKKYLEKNYGINMVKRKELRPVFTISMKSRD
jgi:hypothetical protein